jgi:hypothetical protein
MEALFEKIFLVRNISMIAGVSAIQDSVLQYALTDEYYMEKAKKHAVHFHPVNSLIKFAISRNNWPRYDFSNGYSNCIITINSGDKNDDGECWQFCIPNVYTENQELQNLPYRIAYEQIANYPNAHTYIHGMNCPKCGEYLVHISQTRLRTCQCDRFESTNYETGYYSDDSGRYDEDYDW